MAINYTKVNWQDKPDTSTPINATNLGKMDNGIKAACDAADSACAVKFNNLPASNLNFSLSGSVLNITIS